MKNLDLYGWIALGIVLFGGINCGFVGLAKFDVIGTIFGFGFLGRLMYIIIGVAAGYLCYLLYLEKSKKPTT